MSTVPVFVEPEELYDLILDSSKQPGKDYVIVDVRDSDYVVIKSKYIVHNNQVLKNNTNRVDIFQVLLTSQPTKCTIRPMILFKISSMYLKCTSTVHFHKFEVNKRNTFKGSTSNL